MVIDCTSLDMSQNSKHDLGQVLGRQKCLLNCTPGPGFGQEGRYDEADRQEVVGSLQGPSKGGSINDVTKEWGRGGVGQKLDVV